MQKKAFDKIQHPFLIKTLKKVGIKGAYLEIIKAIYERPNANIILNGEKLRAFPQVRNKRGMSTITTVLQHSIGSLSLCNQTTQRNKRHPNWPGGDQTFPLHRWHDSLCGKPKRVHQKALELIHQFSNVAGYKINAQKLVSFLYTNNEATEREIKESIPFTVAQKTIKYLAINVIKEVKKLYTENYRKLMNEIEEDTKKMEKDSMLPDRKNKYC